MTTPAVDKVSYLRGTGTSRVYNYATGESGGEATYRDLPYQRYWEYRPESINNPMDSSRWRKPSPWASAHERTTQRPYTAFEIGPFDADGNIFQQFYDGAGWNDASGVYLPLSSNLVSRAEVKALSKLKNQKVNFAQAFAEREQTAELFLSVAKKISKSVSAWRNKNPRKLWELVKGSEGQRGKSIPSSWLEVQYGWNPLMQDIQGSCDLLQSRDFNGQSYRVDVKASVKERDTYLWEKRTDVTADMGFTIKAQRQNVAKVHLTYVLENPFAHTLAQSGLLNPAALAWELLPYSFVIDWFAPVGDWLNTLDASVGYSFLGGTWSVFRILDESVAGVYVRNNAGRFLTSPNYFQRSRLLNRSVYSQSPLPGFPGVKNPFSPGHVANAMALLTQAFSR